MSSPINKKTLERLAELARLKLNSREEEKLLVDLVKILDYFKELQEVDTSKTAPQVGGAFLKNAFREDGERESSLRGAGVESFPDNQKGLLTVPPVFD